MKAQKAIQTAAMKARVNAQKIAEEMMKSGASKTIKAEDKSIMLKAGKPND